MLSERSRKIWIKVARVLSGQRRVGMLEGQLHHVGAAQGPGGERPAEPFRCLGEIRLPVRQPQVGVQPLRSHGRQGRAGNVAALQQLHQGIEQLLGAGRGRDRLVGGLAHFGPIDEFAAELHDDDRVRLIDRLHQQRDHDGEQKARDDGQKHEPMMPANDLEDVAECQSVVGDAHFPRGGAGRGTVRICQFVDSRV